MDPEKQSNTGQFLISERFDDFDQFAEQTRHWDFNFCQLDRGGFQARLTQLVTRRVLVSDFDLGRRIEQRGSPPSGFRTFGIPAEDDFSIRWRGELLGSDHLMLFPPGNELDCISEPGFRAIGISVSEQLLEEIATRRGMKSVDHLFPKSNVVRCLPAIRCHLRDLAQTLLESAGHDPDVLNNPWYRITLEELLVETLLRTLDTSHPEKSSPRMTATRRHALKNALMVIAEFAHTPITAHDIERLSGASGRTLRYAFKEEFGLSPTRYLHAYRLNRIHQELTKTDVPGLTVSEVAKAWGLWHMGQFSGDYRKMFGKSPRETLAANT